MVRGIESHGPIPTKGGGGQNGALNCFYFPPTIGFTGVGRRSTTDLMAAKMSDSVVRRDPLLGGRRGRGSMRMTPWYPLFHVSMLKVAWGA